jgi:hypothetical protein
MSSVILEIDFQDGDSLIFRYNGTDSQRINGTNYKKLHGPFQVAGGFSGSPILYADNADGPNTIASLRIAQSGSYAVEGAAFRDNWVQSKNPVRDGQGFYRYLKTDLRLLRCLKYVTYGCGVPNPFALLTSSWADAFIVESGGNGIKGRTGSAQGLHALDDSLFTVAVAVGLAAFTAACTRLLTLACAAQLDYQHRFLILRDGSEHLPHKFAAGIVAAQVRLGDTDDLDALLAQLADDRLLHHQVTGKPVKLLNDDGMHAVAVERCDQVLQCGPVLQLLGAGYTFLAKGHRQGDVVGDGILTDGGHLAGKAVFVFSGLRLAAHSQVCKRFFSCFPCFPDSHFSPHLYI